ncbi:MAG: CAP domain-containing protein [Verrucomicrobiaceae bacterium]
MKLLLALTLGLIAVLPAQEAGEQIPAMAVRKALQWMQDQNPERRQAAYRSFQLYGESAKPVYRATLEKARAAHEKRLARLLADQNENPFHGIDLLTEDLDQERKRIFPLIHTDYKKDSGKIKMLRNEVESLTRLNQQIRKIAKADSAKFEAAVSAITTALVEVHRELQLIDEDEPAQDPLTPEQVLNDSFDGEVYLTTKNQIAAIRKEVDLLKSTTEQNTAFPWANASQKDFTALLNANRTLFGIPPLLINERLSAAAKGHSVDMATLGFFAHESPVEGKKSPWDRARVAKFQHQATGENIFMGSSSHTSAYNAWFASDGHRFIMFSQGANLIGIGPHGSHWTMMTGKK